MYAELTGKYCATCKEIKGLENFNSDKKSKDGKSWECKPCRSIRRKKSYSQISAYNKKWRLDNLEYAKLRDKKNNLTKKFNITLDEFEKLRASQNNGCAICSKIRSSSKKDLCVDHCHQTGKIRGLLCDNCNRGIGLLRDSIPLLLKAITYLENSKK